MGKVTICGHSDDLIYVEGALEDEIVHRGELTHLAFSDGTVLSVHYGWCWDIRVVIEGTATCVVEHHDNGRTRESDVVTLTGDLQWVVSGQFAERKVANG